MSFFRTGIILLLFIWLIEILSFCAWFIYLDREIRKVDADFDMWRQELGARNQR